MEAVRLIEHLLTVPANMHPSEMYGMMLTELKWRWQWDPLRSHQRFQKILAAAEPKTVYRATRKSGKATKPGTFSRNSTPRR
jgi:hypothetical protein